MKILDFFKGVGRALDPTISQETGAVRRKTTSPYESVGSLGVSVYGGYVQEDEKDARLTGTTRFKTFSEIMVNHPIVSASVMYFLGLIGKAQWTFQPADDSKEAQEIADFVERALTEDPVNSWQTINKRAALAKFFGFAIQEWTAQKNDKGEVTLYDVAIRTQKTIERWDINHDGTINGVVQRSEQDGSEIYIPRTKFVYTVDNVLNDSPRGEGLFRMVVKHIFMLKLYEKLEGIAYETDLSGVPVVKAPMIRLQEAINKGNLTEAQVKNMIGGFYDFIEKRNRGEKAPGLIMDSEPYRTIDDRQSPSSTPQFEVELMNGATQFMSEISDAIMREDRRIARVFGTESLVLGETAGSYALSKDKNHQFLMHVDGQLMANARAFTRDLVIPLFKLNGIDMALLPKLVPESMRFRDIEQVATALTALSTAGLMPNDPAINDVRGMAGISPMPPEIIEQMEEDHMADLESKREAMLGNNKPSDKVPEEEGKNKDKNNGK